MEILGIIKGESPDSTVIMITGYPSIKIAVQAIKMGAYDFLAKPFPPDVRAEIYGHYVGEIRRRDADVPISLSTETLELWKAMAPALGATAVNYVCGCGPGSTPGRKRLAGDPFAVAGPVGGFQRM